MPKYIKQGLSKIHPVVLSKYYGCGLCIPDYDLNGASVLDLGCGAGRDVYLVSQLVGECGRVVGVDMTMELLNIASSYRDHHAKEFGHAESNVHFVQAYLEKLGTTDALQEQSFDLIISNCVINLCTDKKAVLDACYKLLKPGGELYFSDVYSNRRVPESLRADPTLWGECLSGALYWNDFHNLAKKSGFADPRLVDDKPISVNNKNVQTMIEQSGNTNLEFFSATYRLQKIDDLEPACEDYGQAVIYKGTIPTGNAQSTWTLDKHHIFETGKIHPVCGNTWNMLYCNPRVKDHFEYIGNFDKHYGIFEGCGSSLPYDRVSGIGSGSSGAACC
jgi:arsenite methyltransferase